MRLEFRRPALLRTDSRNPRNHPSEQIKKLQASIEAFGFCNPILIDDSGLIIAGHGRHLAAKALDLATVPVIVLEGLSEAQKRALRIADNKLAEGSGWDRALLAGELRFLSDAEFALDLSLTGFSIAEADVILLGTTADAEDAPVWVSESQAVSQSGDIWRLGPHVIGCGDARDPAILRALVGDRPVDAAFLDPPYNVRVGGFCVRKGSHREFEMASGELTDPEFTEFLRSTLHECAAVSRDGAVHFVCMDHRHLENLATAGRDVYGARLNICIWNKSNAGMGSLYRSKHELIAVFRVGTEAFYNAVELGRHGRNRTNVWDYPSVNTFEKSRRGELSLHPTVKPHAMVADAIRDVTKRGDHVLDAFLGAGTTLLACDRTGRVCRGLELDPRYVDLAITRWMQATGQEAHHAVTAESFTRRSKSTMEGVPEIV